jgi:hypothetical protein
MVYGLFRTDYQRIRGRGIFYATRCRWDKDACCGRASNPPEEGENQKLSETRAEARSSSFDLALLKQVSPKWSPVRVNRQRALADQTAVCFDCNITLGWYQSIAKIFHLIYTKPVHI